MILKNNRFLFGALFLCLPSLISANITTLQSWDPIPFFNAANLNMPPDTPFCYEVYNRLLDKNDAKPHHFGFTISPFVQKAIRAQQADNLYYGDYTNATSISAGVAIDTATGLPIRQMGDYQGTAFLMGLFLGQDKNGNSIWGGPTSSDTGLITQITTATVDATLLAPFLKDAVNALNDNPDAVISPLTPGPDSILFYVPTNSTYTAPSILSQSVLEQDQTYFGAFSMPLTYQKSGFRWELNFDVCDDFGVLVRGGFCQITQRVTLPIPLSALAPVIQQATGQNSPAVNGIYNELNTYSNAKTNTTNVTGGLPVPTAQAIFNEWVQNNVDDLLDPEFGANYDIKTFSEAGIEDMQFLAFFRHPFLLHPVNPDRYASIIVTPYFMVGATAPIAPIKDYSKLYALPFGNNGHISVGGVVGTTFDFMDRLEFGFEFGATGFIKQTIDQLPLPNHELQRVLYPYRENVIYQPGFNGQFAAIFNAYEFIRNINFSFRYNYVQHTQDTITMVTPNPYFFPIYLEELTAWSSQMFIAALTFKIQSNIYLSAAWQGALSQKNAYCSNTILGSLNFIF